MQRRGVAGKPQCHRRQASSHKNCVARKFDACRDYCGSGLARDAGGAMWQANRSDAIAGKPAHTRIVSHANLMLAGIIVGAGLPAIQAARYGRQTALLPSQASQLPQELCRTQNLMLAGIIVGAGLPAMQAARCGRQTAVMPSQASQLPQVLCCPQDSSLAGCGLRLALQRLGFELDPGQAVGNQRTDIAVVSAFRRGQYRTVMLAKRQQGLLIDQTFQ